MEVGVRPAGVAQILAKAVGTLIEQKREIAMILAPPPASRIPEHMCCPISHDIMSQFAAPRHEPATSRFDDAFFSHRPVIAADGNTRAARARSTAPRPVRPRPRRLLAGTNAYASRAGSRAAPRRAPSRICHSKTIA